MLLLKVNEVTNKHQKWPKIIKNSMKNLILPDVKKVLVQKPKPSAGARSKPA